MQSMIPEGGKLSSIDLHCFAAGKKQFGGDDYVKVYSPRAKNRVGGFVEFFCDKN